MDATKHALQNIIGSLQEFAKQVEDIYWKHTAEVAAFAPNDPAYPHIEIRDVDRLLEPILADERHHRQAEDVQDAVGAVAIEGVSRGIRFGAMLAAVLIANPPDPAPAPSGD